MIYTPGVARVCLAIAKNPEDARRLTIKRNSIAVITDGSAVLGLGNLRARGCIAGDGRKGSAVQAVRRHRCLAAVPGHPGRRRDRHRGEGGRPRICRNQSGGYFGTALLRGRAPVATAAGHPGIPR